jgi:hypothetical protein
MDVKISSLIDPAEDPKKQPRLRLLTKVLHGVTSIGRWKMWHDKRRLDTSHPMTHPFISRRNATEVWTRHCYLHALLTIQYNNSNNCDGEEHSRPL